MPKNKKTSSDKVVRTYHPNSYTFDQTSESSDMRNFTDPVMEKLYDERMKQGGVGPERSSDHSKRTMDIYRAIQAGNKQRSIDNANKQRGTVSSAVRREIK